MNNPYGLPLPGGPDFKLLESSLDGDWVVTCDWHLPFYDLDLATRMLRVATELKMKNLLIAGDLFNFGYLSRFEDFYEAREEGMDADAKMARQLFLSLLGMFDKVVLVPGNHDHRLQRALRSKISVKAMFGLFLPEQVLEQVLIAPLPYIVLNTERGAFRVTHPSAYSVNSLIVPQALCDKFHMHIIAAHGHHLAVGMARDGQHVIAESGGLFKPEKIDYKYLVGDTRHPEWSNGFILVKDGRVIPVGDHFGF